MHIFFSGIGGGGLAPGALIAKDAGYRVSGSDQKDSQYIKYLNSQGVEAYVGQTTERLAKLHAEHSIDLFVYTLALPNDHPEMEFCREHNIRTVPIYGFLAEFVKEKGLEVIAIAGTHGKTTTTAMTVWAFKELGIPVSYSIGAKASFGPMGQYDAKSKYFIVEADEFGQKFLAYHPKLSLIPGIAYDHHEQYPTIEDYFEAFRKFISQSQQTVMWREDAEKLNTLSNPSIVAEREDNPEIEKIKLAGLYNRRNGWLVAKGLSGFLDKEQSELLKIISRFPGLSRRFEKIAPNLYSDYAHTPEKIIGGMSVAKETAAPGQKIVVLYEPLTNRRMQYTAAAHRDVFEGASKLYWIPSYLAREDPNQSVLSPSELIKNLAPELQAVAEPAELNENLTGKIRQHLDDGDLVVAMSGGGGNSLDEWLRQEFAV